MNSWTTVYLPEMKEALDPKPEGVEGFNKFMDRYLKGLPIERAAVESKIW